jgi:long-chain acyl-CoA synthetase
METSTPSRYSPGPHDLMGDVVREHATSHPDRVAVSRRVGQQWLPVTCEALAADVEALAVGLVGAGIRAGERVALMSRTRYEWLLYDLAILSVGAVTVPIYETSSAEQVEWILSDSGAVAAIVETDGQHAIVHALRERLPALRDLWRVESDRFRLVENGFGLGPEVTAQQREGTGPDSLATIVYTSGTTGRPKGCALTHGNLLALVHNVLDADGIREEVFNERQSTLLFLPLAHILARTIQLGALEAGVRLGHTDMSNVAADLQSFKPTTILSVPRVFEKIYNSTEQKATAEGKGKIFASAARTAIAWSTAHDDGKPGALLNAKHALFDKLVYGKLRAAMGGKVTYAISGGAPLGTRLGHFYRGIGLTVLEGYGLTETTAPATLNTPETIKIGTVGPPLPGVSIQIADDGEILVKGNSVFSAYRNNETATNDAIVDGWFHTGDIGELDHDGYLKITGRKKEILITAGGKNVVPAVLEDRLRAHPLVSQCIVVGDQKPFIGALITLDAEMLPSWAENHGLQGLSVESARTNKVVLAEVQKAVDDANLAVSRAESIRKFTILSGDFTEDNGYLTPSLKLKRNIVMKDYSAEVEALYSGPEV